LGLLRAISAKAQKGDLVVMNKRIKKLSELIQKRLK